MYKEDLALNNQQWLICHKKQIKNFTLHESWYVSTTLTVLLNQAGNIEPSFNPYANIF